MLLFQPVALLLLCVPVLSTFGPSARENRPVLKGLGTLLGLLALTFVMYGLSFFLIGQPEGIFTGRLSAPGVDNMMSASWDSSHRFGNVFTVAVAVSASLAGLWAIGWLLSVTTRNRWAALSLSGFLLLVVLIAPMIAKAGYMTEPVVGHEPAVQSHRVSLLINLIYLDPFGSLLQATGDSDRYTHSLSLLFGWTPIWQVTTLGYAGIAGVVGLAAWRMKARRPVRADLAVSC